MQLIIDSRETRLLQDLTTSNTKCEKEYLALGDIIFKDKDTGQEIIIERKTWADLWASIQDGRYREQRSRLVECRDATLSSNIVYLIEGSCRSLVAEAAETCRRALVRLQVAYRIPVVMTDSVEETVEWLRWFYAKEKLGIFLKTCDTQEERIESIQSRLNNKKASIQNPKTMLVTFLRSISGVSYAVATTIAEPFESIRNMVERREELDAMLPLLEYTTPSRKQRKVGPKLAQKIISLLG
jgi:ERCC4-type nuclease